MREFFLGSYARVVGIFAAASPQDNESVAATAGCADVQFKKPKANTQVIKYRIHGATGDKKVH